MISTIKSMIKPVAKFSLVGAVLAATPLVDLVPGVSGAAYAQNVCADGKPFKSTRKTQTMNTRVYRKYEKVLEHLDAAGELRKQSDLLKSQAKEAEALAATKTSEQAAEAQALRAQAQTALAQVPALESQWETQMSQAESLIKDVLGSSRTPDYDRASVLQLYSQINFERGDTKAAIGNLEEMLKYRSYLKELREHSIVYSVAQLNYSEERYDRALGYLDDWFKLSENVCHTVTLTQNTFIAQLYYVTKDYNNALKYINKSIAEAEADPETDSKEAWYQLAASSYYELGQIDNYRDVLETMVVKWGKPDYYKRLASVHQELGQDEISYSLFEAIYEMGWMDNKENEIKMVAQIQFARSSAIKAAWILEAAMNDGRMKKSTDNTKLLGQAYMSAYEFEKAVGPMSKVAEDEKDPNTYLQIAGMEYGNGNYSNAVRLFDKAIDLFAKSKSKANKAKLDSAKLGKGASLMDMNRIMDACKVFQDVARTSGTSKYRKQANQYKRLVTADIARQDMFTGKDSKRVCK